MYDVLEALDSEAYYEDSFQFNDSKHGNGILIQTNAGGMSSVFLWGLEAYSVECSTDPFDEMYCYIIQMENKKHLTPKQVYALFLRVVPKDDLHDIIKREIKIQATKSYNFDGMLDLPLADRKIVEHRIANE